MVVPDELGGGLLIFRKPPYPLKVCIIFLSGQCGDNPLRGLAKYGTSPRASFSGVAGATYSARVVPHASIPQNKGKVKGYLNGGF